MNAQKHKVAWDYNEILSLSKQFGKYKQWFAVVTYTSMSRQQAQQAGDSQGVLLLPGEEQSTKLMAQPNLSASMQLATTVSRWLFNKKTEINRN